jgi:hypothetical protein
VDLDFVQAATGVLAMLCIVLTVVVLCTVRSVGTRLVVVVLMAASFAGLIYYRNTLDDCDKNGCACKLFGEDLEGGGCAVETAAGE